MTQADAVGYANATQKLVDQEFRVMVDLAFQLAKMVAQACGARVL